MDAVGVFLCVALFALPLGLLIGAIILRGGVSYANKCIPKEVESEYEYEDWDDYDRPKRKRRGGATIPEPGVGKAMGIVFLNAVTILAIIVPLGFVARLMMDAPGGEDDEEILLLLSFIQLPIGFLVAAGLRAAMLPTTVARACLVVLFEYLIALAICAILAIPLVALAFLAG